MPHRDPYLVIYWWLRLIAACGAIFAAVVGLVWWLRGL